MERLPPSRTRNDLALTADSSRQIHAVQLMLVRGYVVFGHPPDRIMDGLGWRHAVLSLQVNNLENRTPITDSAGRAAIGASGPLLVHVLAPHNRFLQLKWDLAS